MKKFFTAIMLLAGASMIAACEKSLVPDDNVNGNENGNGNSNEQTDQSDQTMDSKVLAATFPLNVKIEMKNQPSYNTAEEDITLIKLGNEWFYENRGYRYVLYLYCQFAKDGKTLKAFGGALQEDSTVKWTNLLTSGDESFLNFAGFAKNSECHVLFDAGLLLIGFQQLPEALAGHALAVHVEEEGLLVLIGQHGRADLFEIGLHRPQGRVVDGDGPFLAPAPEEGQPCREI